MVYPLPGLLTAIVVTLPLKVNAEARACIPPAALGGPIVTVGFTVNPLPAVSRTILLTLCPVRLIPTRGNCVVESNSVRKTSFSSAPVPTLIVASLSPISLGFTPLIFSLSELI